MAHKKKILIAPLNWGLGHATRCIPIIQEIIALGHEPIIASDGRSCDLLHSEFPGLTIIRLPGYNPVYPKNGNMFLKMGLQVPKFLLAIAREHDQLKKIIHNYSIDAIISDNRYGLWCKKVKSVLITHQVFIRMPSGMRWMRFVFNLPNHFFIRQYHACWVPDEEGEMNLSGDLSHGKMPANARYIGLLSRFQLNHAEDNPEHTGYDLLALLSGPEPQRTILEKEIIKQSTISKIRTLIVRGVTEENNREKLNEFVEMVSHLKSEALGEAISKAKAVICRAGYSSLMDLIALQKKAIIIPTPGQTEQEYLAERCDDAAYFLSKKQSEIDLNEALSQFESTKLPRIPVNTFRKELIELLDAV